MQNKDFLARQMTNLAANETVSFGSIGLRKAIGDDIDFLWRRDQCVIAL
ncbi:hypothetical protein [Cysteiniphilum sp. QT6929]|nr:hypothetical protein [Cysteiniphilum sp. QT6929]WHN66077.1 hypothetical protein NYP54_02280 [Cysteiniphilum sp. QT6929]